MLICITGPMAAGKNAVCTILEKKGFVSIDADIAGHRAVEDSKEKILAAFGSYAKERNIELLDCEGKINRRNLAQIVFSSPELLKRHEEIVFGKITEIIEQFIKDNKTKNVIVNATVLYKIPLVKRMDKIIYVDCPALIRLFRAKRRDRMSCKHIILRFYSQRNLFAKYKLSGADIVKVWNFGSQKKLRVIVEKLVDSL